MTFMSIVSTKAVYLSLGIIILASAGFGVYHYTSSRNSDSAPVEEKITGPQASGQEVSVNRATLEASPTNFGSEEVVNAGYIVSTYVNLYSNKKMTKVALEELKVNNLEAMGDCTTSEKDATVSTYYSGVQQGGYISFKMSCRTGISYSVSGVLDTTGEWSGGKLLSYGGITPPALARSLTFDVAVKFDDGTITKKSFNGTISGQALWNGDFGAGSLSGEGDNF